MPGLVKTARHGTGSRGGSPAVAPARIVASSAAFTAGWSAGSSRNQNQNPTAHTTPMAPNATNVHRHPTASIRYAADAGAATAPSWAAVRSSPCTRPRSAAGTHRDRMRATFGYAPASPAPNRKRMTISDTSPVPAPVRAVNTDHQTATRVSTDRAPARSPHRPVGTSNSPYATVNA